MTSGLVPGLAEGMLSKVETAGSDELIGGAAGTDGSGCTVTDGDGRDGSDAGMGAAVLAGSGLNS